MPLPQITPNYSPAISFVLQLFRRLADEDDELSEVQPDAVPPEVREWLASTFTRQLATTRKKSDEKPKFRSVAHAIRAGIFVDRIYRRVSSTALMTFPPEVVKVLKVRFDMLPKMIYYQTVRFSYYNAYFFFLMFFRLWMTGVSMYLHWLRLPMASR